MSKWQSLWMTEQAEQQQGQARTRARSRSRLRAAGVLQRPLVAGMDHRDSSLPCAPCPLGQCPVRSAKKAPCRNFLSAPAAASSLLQTDCSFFIRKATQWLQLSPCPRSASLRSAGWRVREGRAHADRPCVAVRLQDPRTDPLERLAAARRHIYHLYLSTARLPTAPRFFPRSGRVTKLPRPWHRQGLYHRSE